MHGPGPHRLPAQTVGGALVLNRHHAARRRGRDLEEVDSTHESWGTI